MPRQKYYIGYQRGYRFDGSSHKWHIKFRSPKRRRGSMLLKLASLNARGCIRKILIKKPGFILLEDWQKEFVYLSGEPLNPDNIYEYGFNWQGVPELKY